MTTLAEPREQCFQLDWVDWTFYEYLLDQLGDRHLFVTFDDGSVELMSPSFKHDKRGRLLGLLVNIVAVELGIPFQGAGSTTFKRKDRQAGLEPDECFYFANVNRVRGKDEIDLSIDPPPDLAIEVEVSRRMIARMPLYAKLGIKEIWRDDGKRIHVHLLGEDGQYRTVDQSETLPMLPMRQVDKFLELAATNDEMTWTRTVQEWVRQNLARQ